MFWLGLAIAFVSGVLSVGISREQVQERYPKVREYHLDLVLLVLLVVGLLISAHNYWSSQQELESLRVQVQELESQARRAARGITETYDFQGNRRSTSPGQIEATMGAKHNVFRKMIALNEEHNWSELLSLCEKEIDSTPEWLTPYLFAGIAQANLGERGEAIQLLRYVEREAAGDPAYSAASDLLQKLGAQ